ncbi:RND family efflux transporter MFP subunit [Wenyingzhuangia heitensis]|uniref:RND family efflux transporter MFP subunit n=1 Tax=Wenyingzhuangia heitensis TaxID=1487859 RepID=A0ABX0UHA3_9FLAO|nr:efflux RND transporter periplasmic adaptor subunit [Wenyingzhuangia heitensis]NIJ46397.1 RND family efflux transporter MFP subunit [Wenyingzhuangia heitensis]
MRHLLMLTAFAFLLASCSHKEEPKIKEPTQKATVKEITSTSENELLTYSGTIEADNIVSLGFSVGGRVNHLAVQEGQRVEKGQLLASIEDISYQNEFIIAEASAEQDTDNFNRLNGLYKKGSLPERDFIAAKVAIAKAKANKSMAAKNLADTKLYAPFTGIITAKTTEIGATATPGVPAFTIMKTDKMYAKASITESEISKLTLGKEATVTVASLNQTFKGTIDILNPSADELTRTFTVKVGLDNSDHKLLPGMISSILINTGNPVNVISIPSVSVVRDANDLLYVFVAENGKAIKKRITVSGFKGNNIIVTSGIKVGDKVLVEGQKNVKEGQAIAL